jgi:hypothetical protein
MMPPAEGDAMQALIRLFADIALHRKGPQDVPAGGAVLRLCLIAYLAVGAAVLWPSADSVGALIAQLAVDVLLLVTVFGGLLGLMGRSARIGQTLAALFGTGALLSLIALPFVWMLAGIAGDPATAPDALPPGAALAGMALLVLLLASLMVTGHIVRHALDWSYAAGVLAAAIYFSLSFSLFRTLFPVE